MRKEMTNSSDYSRIPPSSQLSNLPPALQRRLTEAALPDKWVERNIGDHFWRIQRDIIRAVAVEPRVAVASCNAAGKSFLAARTVMAFLKTYPESLVVTTAPTDRQVRKILWREIHAAYAKALRRGINLGPKPMTKEWRLSDTHLAFGFATKDYDADAFQGLHAKHVLVVVDEAAGISETIWDGVFSVLRGAHSRLLAIGNPTTVEGKFFEAFQSDAWKTFHISAFDTPNLQGEGIVIPGLITEEDVALALQDWGEDSPMYVSRILGKFPDAMEDTLINLRLVEKAAQGGKWEPEEIEEEEKDEPIEVGMDCARFGEDENVMIARRGAFAFKGEAFGAESLGRTGVMAAAGRLVQFLEGLGMWKIRRVKVDAVGLGGGVPDRLRELQDEGKIPANIEIVDMNAGAKAADPDRYADASTEWYFGLRDRMQEGRAYGPVFEIKKVQAQLTRRKYHVLSDGRYKLEPKDALRKRRLTSPDWGDALAFAFAETGGTTFGPDTAKIVQKLKLYGR